MYVLINGFFPSTLTTAGYFCLLALVGPFLTFDVSLACPSLQLRHAEHAVLLVLVDDLVLALEPPLFESVAAVDPVPAVARPVSFVGKTKSESIDQHVSMICQHSTTTRKPSTNHHHHHAWVGDIYALDVEAVGLGRGALVLGLELHAARRLRLALLLQHVLGLVLWMMRV